MEAGSSIRLPQALGPRVLDVSNMDVVFRGKVWDHAEDPSAKSVTHLLERNESIVTWLQPRGGSVEDQVPAINVNGQYRGITLRMQKSIWRHVCLKKGFINLESLSQVSCQKHTTSSRAKVLCNHIQIIRRTRAPMGSGAGGL